MKNNKIEALLNECDYPCISIILPTNSLDEFNHYIGEAESMMRKIDVPQITIRKIVDALRRTSATAAELGDFGLGVFTSSRVAAAVSFPFAVGKSVSVDQFFDTEYLIRLQQLENEPVS